MKTKVAIVEDHEKTLEYLSALFSGSDGIELSCSCSTGEEVIEKVFQAPPDVLVVDINLPDMSGVEVIRAVKERIPRVEVLVLTMHESREHLFSALQAGATGYLVKGASSTEIVNAVSLLMAGGAPMSPTVALRHRGVSGHQELTGEDDPHEEGERSAPGGGVGSFGEKACRGSIGEPPHDPHAHQKNLPQAPGQLTGRSGPEGEEQGDRLSSGGELASARRAFPERYP